MLSTRLKYKSLQVECDTTLTNRICTNIRVTTSVTLLYRLFKANFQQDRVKLFEVPS